MPNYRRDYTGTVWFFTVVTDGRKPLFRDPVARCALHAALVRCRRRFPFAIDAFVLLPDHLHCIWTLPVADRNYSRRWGAIKLHFNRVYRQATSHVPPFWQRRFWAHRIDNETDYRAHLDYVHYNPVKHGLVGDPIAWRWSSLHRLTAEGTYPSGWGGGIDLPLAVGRE